MRHARSGGQWVTAYVPYTVERDECSIDVFYTVTGKTSVPEHKPHGVHTHPDDYDPGSGPEDIELQGVEVEHIEGEKQITYSHAKRLAAETFQEWPDELAWKCEEAMNEVDDDA